MLTPPPHYQSFFSPAEFRRRHADLYDAIGHDAVAVIQGGGPVGGFEIFRQTNEFFYLTGVEMPQAYLMLDGRQRRATLYLPHRDEKHAASEGEELCAEDAELLRGLTGCDEIAGMERLEADVRDATILYTPHSPAEGAMASPDMLRRAAKLIAADPWAAQSPRESFFIARLRERAPAAELRDLSPILDRMRITKSPAEVAVMRRAGWLTGLAVVEAMKSTRPGVYEYQLGAIAEYVYRVNGARGASYTPIISSGANIWLPHYCRNTSVLQAGELVLMDVAPDVCNYTSDIGRMWPVNGRYSDTQRLLYGFIVEFHKALLGRLRPGVLPEQVFREAAADMAPYVSRMHFADPAHEKGVRRALEKDRALTHPVGMCVHDVGEYKNEPFKPGCVFALDPQLWVPEQKLYIRVEDTVAITETGVESLTAAAPLELDEIEALIGRNGMLAAFPPA